jgi:membrane-associated protein
MIGLTPEKVIQSGCVLLIGAIIFAESALLIGIILPGGDTMLFIAGFFASQGYLPIGWLITAIVIGAILGDNVGYTIGRRAGPRLFKKEQGIFFRKDHVTRAERFYKAHGGKAITLARFVPVIRTLAPMIAGVGKMDRKRFMFFNVLGALIWGIGVPLLGYFFGSQIPNIDAYIIPLVLFSTLIVFAPPIWHIVRDKKMRTRLGAKTKYSLQRALRYLSLNKRVDLD